MVLLLLLLAATCFLAYSNGANDNFKGVATLFGSHTTTYWRALLWATATTFTGSVASIFLARTLVHRFSGKGLVPDAVAASPEFLLAVALGAGLTVLLATLLGFPISTTHSLTGALYQGRVLGLNAQTMLDAAHYGSAGVVSFARGLNDTPKIVALLLAVEGLALAHGLLAVAVAMAVGGLLNARRVAETMSRKIRR